MLEFWIQKLPPGLSVQEVVDQLYLKTLTDCLGVKTHAAETLGVSIKGFRQRLKQIEKRGLVIPESLVEPHQIRLRRPAWLKPKKPVPQWEF